MNSATNTIKDPNPAYTQIRFSANTIRKHGSPVKRTGNEELGEVEIRHLVISFLKQTSISYRGKIVHQGHCLSITRSTFLTATKRYVDKALDRELGTHSQRRQSLLQAVNFTGFFSTCQQVATNLLISFSCNSRHPSNCKLYNYPGMGVPNGIKLTLEGPLRVFLKRVSASVCSLLNVGFFFDL